MMQMEWCNQFDSSIRIHQRQRGGRGGERGREGMREDSSTVLLFRF